MHTFPLADMPSLDEFLALDLDPKYGHKHIAAVPACQFRPPRKGEWYLSGAIPMAYKAPNDLDTSYAILYLARIETVTTTNVLKVLS
jgi:hypothetical protein